MSISPVLLTTDYAGKDILSLDQFSLDDLFLLFSQAEKMKRIADASQPSTILAGTITTLLFYEPSSRTFNSFAAAIKRLGGQTLEIHNPETSSSVAKGESLSDTIQVFASYSDAIVIRHHTAGSVAQAADATTIPVINAGDGIGEHPSQALLDLFTIQQHMGRLEGLTGVITGDLLHGRTVHSLLRGLSLFPHNRLYLLSPEVLQLTSEDKAYFQEKGLALHVIHSEKDMPKDADFWYWTRVQKERFTSLDAYEKIKNSFILTPQLIEERAGKSTIFLHPLPRLEEIEIAVDQDPRAVYLTEQVRNGLYIRMALLALVLGRVS